MQTENKASWLKAYWVDIAFLATVILLFFLFGFYQHFYDGPGGIHYIRQTDSLAFIDHYQENGHNFFKPGTLNLDSEDGNAACEFPIIYYVLSFLYSGFGKHYFFLKLINLGIVLTGLYHLLKLSQKLLKDNVYALLIVLFLFTSTLFNYYIFNFLPDAAALGLTLIGWHSTYKQFHSNRPKWYKPFIFFALAGLIKVTFFISPIAIVGFAVIQSLRGEKNNSLKQILSWFGLSIFLIACWNVYVLLYNNHFQTEYFTTGSRAIWGMPDTEVSKTWDHIFNFWFIDYLAHSSHHVLWLLGGLQLVLFKKLGKYAILLGLLLLGAGCYFLLFFSQFKDHDYYALALFPIIVALLVGSIRSLQTAWDNKYVEWTSKVVLAIVVILGINYAGTRVNNRLDQRLDQISYMGIHLENTSKEVQNVVPEEAAVLILKDQSKNGGLLAIERKGWTLPLDESYTQDTLDYFLKEGLEIIISPTNLPLKYLQKDLDFQVSYQDSAITVCTLLP